MGAAPNRIWLAVLDGVCPANFTPFTVVVRPAVTAANRVPPVRTSDGRPVSSTLFVQAISAAVAANAVPLETAAAAAIVSKTLTVLVQFLSS